MWRSGGLCIITVFVWPAKCCCTFNSGRIDPPLLAMPSLSACCPAPTAKVNRITHRALQASFHLLWEMPFTLISDLLCLEDKFIIHLLRFAKPKIHQRCRGAKIEPLNVYSSCTVSDRSNQGTGSTQGQHSLRPTPGLHGGAGSPEELPASRVHMADCCLPVVWHAHYNRSENICRKSSQRSALFSLCLIYLIQLGCCLDCIKHRRRIICPQEALITLIRVIIFSCFYVQSIKSVRFKACFHCPKMFFLQSDCLILLCVFVNCCN